VNKLNKFANKLNEIKGDLDRNLKSPTMSAGRVGRLLLQLVNATIEENTRLNNEITKLKQEIKTKKTYTRL